MLQIQACRNNKFPTIQYTILVCMYKDCFANPFTDMGIIWLCMCIYCVWIVIDYIAPLHRLIFSVPRLQYKPLGALFNMTGKLTMSPSSVFLLLFYCFIICSCSCVMSINYSSYIHYYCSCCFVQRNEYIIKTLVHIVLLSSQIKFTHGLNFSFCI